jgi:hypothetical protein
MTDIVIRTLTKSEAHALRLLKAQLDEPTWRALFLRVLKERTNSIVIKQEDVQELFEILCDIPYEDPGISDTEPPTKRHSAIEAIINQLRERISEEDEYED